MPVLNLIQVDSFPPLTSMSNRNNLFQYHSYYLFLVFLPRLVTFPPTGNIFAPLEKTIHHSNTSHGVVTNHNTVSPNSRNPTPPPPPHNSHVVLPLHFPLRLEYYSVVRMISKYQSTHYSMLLPSAFSSQAFPSRLYFFSC
ncbi:hypothetical protein S83_069967 [Arachis hypogaea]